MDKGDQNHVTHQRDSSTGSVKSGGYQYLKGVGGLLTGEGEEDDGKEDDGSKGEEIQSGQQ